MDLERQAERLVSEFLAPLVIGGLAVFCYLALLARTHLKARLMIDLYREAGRLRKKQEEIRNREGDAPHLQKYQRLEQGLLRLVDREGLRPGQRRPAGAARPAPQGRAVGAVPQSPAGLRGDAVGVR